MDYYFVCVCGREWWFSQEDVETDYLCCSECGEEIPVEELTLEEEF